MLSNNFMKIVPIIAMAFIIGCGGSKTTLLPAAKDDLKTPEWFKADPKKGFFMAAVTETSKDLQMSITKAEVMGRAVIARQMGTLVEDSIKKFAEEVGTDIDAETMSQFQQTMRNRSQQSMSGAHIVKQDFLNDGGVYRSFVLMALSKEEAISGIMEVVNAMGSKSTRLRATEAYKDLEKEMEVFND